MRNTFIFILVAAALGLVWACGDDDGGNQPIPDAAVPDAQVFACGNGVVEPGEQCDDHNRVNGDGCNYDCQWEGSCGNGVHEAPEECDGTDGLPTCVQLGYLDGTTTCSASCLVEPTCSNTAGALVAWYKLDGATGVVVDSTSQGNGCNTVGSLERDFPGVVAKAFLFNGTDAYADCGTGNDMGGMDALTLEVWAKVNDFTPDGMLVTRAVDADQIAYALGLAGATNHLGATSFRVFFAVEGFDAFVESTSFLPSGEWKHLAATYEAGALTIYIDGVESGSATQVDTGPVADPASARTQLGHLHDAGGQSTWSTFYSGFLDEVKIWSEARTPAQICADAGGTPGAQGACEIILE